MSSAHGETSAGRAGRTPEKPTSLPAKAWGGVLKRTAREFSADNLTDSAAALRNYVATRSSTTRRMSGWIWTNTSAPSASWRRR